MNLNRRQALSLFGSLPILHLAGCGKNSDIVNLSYWGTGTLDVGTRNWALAKDDINVDVQFSDNGNDLGPVIARMISGTASNDYDLGGIQGGAEPALFEAGKILPWDTSRLKNWNNVWDTVKNIPYLNVDGKQIGIPIVVNADSIIYDEAKTGVVDSYAYVFDKAFKGKASMEDSWMNSVIFTAIFMKENNIDGMGKIIDPGNLLEDELYTVIEYLKKHKKDGQFYKFWNGWNEGVELISSGDVVIMTGWEPIVYEAQKRGLKSVKYAEPVEGYEGWSNNLVLHAGVRSKKGVERGAEEAAYRFADWLLGGSYGCMLGKMRGYMVPSTSCVTLLEKNGPLSFTDSNGATASVALDEAESLSSHVLNKLNNQKGNLYWQNARPDRYPLYERLWAELRTT